MPTSLPVLLYLDDYIKANGYVATVPLHLNFLCRKKTGKNQVQFIKPIIHRTDGKTQMFMISTPARLEFRKNINQKLVNDFVVNLQSYGSTYNGGTNVADTI